MSRASNRAFKDRLRENANHQGVEVPLTPRQKRDLSRQAGKVIQQVIRGERPLLRSPKLHDDRAEATKVVSDG